MRIVMDHAFSPAEAKAAGYISIGDAIASGLTKSDRTTLYRQAVEAKTLPSCLVAKGGRRVVWILASALAKQDLAKGASYPDLLEQWLVEFENGAFTGQPQSPNYTKRLRHSLKRFWDIVGGKPSIAGINAKNFRLVLAAKEYAIDDENQIDHHSAKNNIYQALVRFTDFLIREGLKTAEDRKELQVQRPKKRFKVKKMVLEDYQIEAALKFNASWRHGRTAFDIILMDMLIALYAFAGIRASEAIKLKMNHVSIRKKQLHVKGKGGKDRFVPVHPELLPRLENWLQYNRPKTESDYFLVQKNHNKLTISLISQRFRRLAKALEDPIHPHALRRSFATIMSNQGMPLKLIQDVLGHADITTTMSYTMSTLQHAQDWMEKNLYASAETKIIASQAEEDDEEDILDEFINS